MHLVSSTGEHLCSQESTLWTMRIASKTGGGRQQTTFWPVHATHLSLINAILSRVPVQPYTRMHGTGEKNC